MIKTFFCIWMCFATISYGQELAPSYEVWNRFLLNTHNSHPIINKIYIADSTQNKNQYFYPESFIEFVFHKQTPDRYTNVLKDSSWIGLVKCYPVLQKRGNLKLNPTVLKQQLDNCFKVRLLKRKQQNHFGQWAKDGESLVRFSEVLFDEPSQKCLFYFEWFGGPFRASASMIFMERKNGKWQLAYEFPLWAS